MTTYAISAGHGGSDPGAIGSGKIEAEVARSIVWWAITDMRAKGYTVTDCTDDSGDANNVLNDQIRKANESGADIDVSVHLNSSSGAPGTGSEVWYFPGANTIGRDLAVKMSAEIAEAMDWDNRGAKASTEFGWLRLTNAPAILIEVCFINNSEDVKDLIGNERLVADVIIRALTGESVGVLAPTVVETPAWDGKIIAGLDRVGTGDAARAWCRQMGCSNSYEHVFVYDGMSDSDGNQALMMAIQFGGVSIGVRNHRNSLTEAVRELEEQRGIVTEIRQVGGGLDPAVLARLKLAAGLS